MGCAGGPSLSEVIWPADCAKNEVDKTMKESTAGTYNYWAIRNGATILLRAIYLMYCIRYVVCPVGPLSLDFGESSV